MLTDASKISGRMFQAHTDRPCARRYPFVAGIELTVAQSEAQIRERTSLSLNLGKEVRSQGAAQEHSAMDAFHFMSEEDIKGEALG